MSASGSARRLSSLQSSGGRWGVSDGDVLDAHLDDEGRLVLERIDPDPLRRLGEAGRGLWHGADPVGEQRAFRAEWDR